MDDAPCSVCGRAVERALACIDIDTNELLCPVHFRERHFKRVYAQRRLERWSPVCAAKREYKEATAVATADAARPPLQPKPAGAQPNGTAPHRPPTAAPPSRIKELAQLPLRHAWSRWRWGALRESMTMARLSDAVDWHMGRYLAQLRTHRSSASLSATAADWRARHHALGLFGRLRSTSFCASASELLGKRFRWRRGMRAWRVFAANASFAADDHMTAVVRCGLRARHRALMRWALATRLYTLDSLEASVAYRLHRRHCLRQALSQLAMHSKLGTGSGREEACRLRRGMQAFARGRASRQLAQAIIRRLSGDGAELAGDPSSDDPDGKPPPPRTSVRVVAAEMRVAEAEAAARAAVSHAASLEASLEECRLLLLTERAEGQRAKDAARRERDTLLETVSGLLEQQAHWESERRGGGGGEAITGPMEQPAWHGGSISAPAMAASMLPSGAGQADYDYEYPWPMPLTVSEAWMETEEPAQYSAPTAALPKLWPAHHPCAALTGGAVHSAPGAPPLGLAHHGQPPRKRLIRISD